MNVSLKILLLSSTSPSTAGHSTEDANPGYLMQGCGEHWDERCSPGLCCCSSPQCSVCSFSQKSFFPLLGSRDSGFAVRGSISSSDNGQNISFRSCHPQAWWWWASCNRSWDVRQTCETWARTGQAKVPPLPLGCNALDLALLYSSELLYRKPGFLHGSVCHRITHNRAAHSNVPFPFWEIRKYHMFWGNRISL